MDKNERKELKRPDAFVERGRAVLEFLNQRRRRFVPVLVAGAALAGVVYVVDWWSERKLVESWSEYTRVSKLTGEARLEGLKTFHGSHGSSRPGFFAALALADHYFAEAKKEALKKDGQPQTSADQAAGWYAKALEFGGLLTGEKQLLHINRGGAYEIAGKLEDAQKDYQIAADFGGDPTGLALLNMGRLYEIKSERAKAEETYQKIINDFGNTEYARLARGFLRRMSSPLFQETKS